MEKSREARGEGGLISKQVSEPLRISMLPLAPRECWTSCEKSGSWPTTMMLSYSENALSSASAVCGDIPHASQSSMSGSEIPAARQNSSAVWRARSTGLLRTRSGRLSAAESTRAALRDCSMPFSISARAKSPPPEEEKSSAFPWRNRSNFIAWCGYLLLGKNVSRGLITLENNA